MSKLTSENKRPVGNMPSPRNGERQPDVTAKRRGADGDAEGSPVNIISKKVADKWLEAVIQREFSVTVHPQHDGFPERFLRAIKDRGEWKCDLNKGKLIVTSNDPFKIVSLVAYLKSKGYFVEEC